ncbi:MAG: hypothetical protein ACJAWW_002563 [Sulfurimonas sp.]|jgi:hypothetical protein
MLLKFIKKNKILLLAIFLLIVIITVISIRQEDEKIQSTPKTKLKNKPQTKPKTLPEVKEKTELEKLNFTVPENFTEIYPVKTTIFVDDNIDFMDELDPVIYSKPKLEIDEIIEENKKINSFIIEQVPIKKKESWKINYEVGLEEGAIKDMKTTGELKTDMLNGKVGVSKSF